jgi:hypothetical protein
MMPISGSTIDDDVHVAAAVLAPNPGRTDGPVTFRPNPCTLAGPHAPPQPPASFGSCASGVAFAVK